MNPSHHPNEAWLLDYALGNIAPAFETVLRAHIGICSSCQDSVRLAERLGGDMLAALEAGPASHLDAKTICATYEQDCESGESFSRAPAQPVSDSVESLVSTYLDSALEAMPWRRIGRDLRLCRLESKADANMWMLRGRPGAVLPLHTHQGDELTLVLKGAYFCGSQIYRAGDIEDADESVEHRPVITRDSECICLAVTTGQLRFKEWLPRLAQPIIGI